MPSAVRRTWANALLAALASLATLASCSSPGARAWNLEQLHDSESRHRYNAALQSETGYFWRQEVFAQLEGAGLALSEVAPEGVEDPATACLENLLALAEHERHEDTPSAASVEWFSRLALEDPAALTRERAVLELGRVGRKLKAGLPARLGSEVQPAGPAELAPVLEELVRATRRVLERKAGEKKDVAQEGLRTACTAVTALDLDLAAARRGLRAAQELVRPFGDSDQRARDLRALVAHLQTVCVRRALGGALADPEGIVRAAAVRSVASCAGPQALDVVLFEMLRLEMQRREGASEVLIAICDVLQREGLPKDGAHAPAEWHAGLYTIARRHLDGRVRTRALQALERTSGAGVKSLREEDWSAWWAARQDSAQPGAASAAASPAAATP